MATIVIADDHVVLRQGLKALLNGLDGWEVVAEAGDGFEVIPLIEEYEPDVVILDLSMPNLGGVETINRLSKMAVTANVLVLTAREDQQSIRDALKAGAKGYLPKTSQASELEFAINAVAAGQTYLSPSICHSVISNGVNGEESKASPIEGLTPREREVMKLLSEGNPNRDVAKTLHISPRTVDSHRANIMKKLGVGSNAEMVTIAMKHGMLT